MAGRLTLWGASQLLTTNWSRTSEPPNSYYLALIRTLAPTPYVSGSELDEPPGDGYARMEIPNDIDNWGQAGQPQVIANLQDVIFTQATDDWGPITYWALCDAPEAGNNFFVGSFETAKSVVGGEVAVVAAGDSAIVLGPFFSPEDD